MAVEMTLEQYSASRLAMCAAWVIANGIVDGVRPKRAPTAEDVRELYAWCSAQYELVRSSDDPEVVSRVRLFRHPGPGPVEIQRWRDYSVRHADVEYEAVAEWLRMQQTAE